MVLATVVSFVAANGIGTCLEAQPLTLPFEIITDIPLEQQMNVSSLEDIPNNAECVPGITTSQNEEIEGGKWFKFSPDNDAIIRFEIIHDDDIGEEVFVFVRVFGGPCDDLLCIPCGSYIDRGVFEATQNETYLFQIMGYGGVSSESTTNVYLGVSKVDSPVHDDIDNAIVIPSVPFSGEYTRVGALSDVNDHVCELRGSVNGVWFAYTPPVDDRILLQISSRTTFPGREPMHSIQVLGDNSTEFKCVARWPNDNRLALPIVGGATYYILVSSPDPFTAEPFSISVQRVGAPAENIEEDSKIPTVEKEPSIMTLSPLAMQQSSAAALSREVPDCVLAFVYSWLLIGAWALLS